jgi:flagellar basal body P-ring formation protein FlgA
MSLNMIRITIVAGLCALLLAPAAAQVTGSTPTLKRQVTMTNEIVRIGDLVDHAGALAGTPIFRAPDLGETGTVTAERVIEAVRPYRLALDTGDISEVVVTRAGHVIPVKDVKAALARALAGRSGLGEAEDLSFAFDMELRPLHLRPSVPTNLEPRQITFDRRSGRFDIMLSAGSASSRDLLFHYTGVVTETRDAVILAVPLARGDVIRQADILIERRPKAELDGGASEKVSDVVGLAARRPLNAGQMLHRADLMKPEIVRQNEPVTLIYEMPGILLTVRGKAVNSGSEGDIVSVINLQSNRTIQGTVVDPGRVKVATSEGRLAVTVDMSAPAPAETGGEAMRRRTE